MTMLKDIVYPIQYYCLTDKHELFSALHFDVNALNYVADISKINT
jgi:hypothetical protein